MTSSLPQQITDDLVRVRHVAGRGNGLFATRDITPNSQVLFVARPIMIALETAKLPTHCYFCYKSPGDPHNALEVDRGQTLKTCSGCKTVRFCDQKCQTRAWAEYHKLECKLFGRLQPRLLPTAVRAIVRALKQHKAGLLLASEWDELLGLESHYDDLVNAGGERWQNVFTMMKGIKSYCGTEHSEDTILRMVCLLMVNSFTLTNPSLDSLGMALHSRSALMNHSCDPNAFVRFDVPPATSVATLPPYGSISVHALRPIAKDEEVTTSYVDTTMPRNKRQEELKTRYFFDCTCSSCSSGTNAAVDFYHLTPDIKQSGERAEQTLLDLQSKASILHSPISAIKSAMKLLADTKAWPLYRYPWPQLRQELFLGLLAQGRFFEAMLHSATFVRAIHSVLYEWEHDPVRVVQMWTFITLCQQCMQSLVLGEKTAEDIRFDVPTLGLLGCVLVGDTHRLMNEGPKANGQLEKLVDAAYGDLSTAGGAWVAYQRNPDAARRHAYSWLDNRVQEFLKREGVAQDIIELSFSRRGS